MDEVAAAHRVELERPHSRHYVWYVIGLLAVVNAFNSMDKMALAALAPLIKVDLQLSDGQLGLLTGLAFALFQGICGIPIARWADWGIRRNIIALALAVWSAMTAISGAAQNFGQLLLARIGVGAGEAGSYSPGASLICDYVPLERRAGVFSINTFGLIAGVMLGIALAGELGEAIGWRWTFVVLGLPGIALAVLIRLSLREPVRGRFDSPVHREARSSFAATVVVLWRCRTYRLLLTFLVLNGFMQNGLTQWWPSFYVRVAGLSLSTMGWYLGIAIGFGMGVGVLVGGLIGHRIGRRDVRLPLKVGAASVVLVMPAALASLFVSSATTSIVLVALTGFFWSVPLGPLMANLYSVIAAHMRATAGSVISFCMALLGVGLGPYCVGVLSDWLTPSLGVQALRYALLAPACLLPPMAVVLLMASRTLRDDLQARRAVQS